METIAVINQNHQVLSQNKAYPLAVGNDLPTLTDEEVIEYRLEKARRLERERKQAEYRTRLMQPVFPVITTWQDFWDYCQARIGFELVIDEDNKQVIQELAAYFGGLTHQHGLNPNKGILLYGNIGTGKTTLMRYLQEAVNAPFRIVSTIDLVNEYQGQKVGQDVITHYSALFQNTVGSRFFGNRNIGLCIDDLGVEAEGNNFGNKKNVIAEILMTRYQNLRTAPNATHATTNLTPAELREMYGARVYDRMREMFNVVEFPASAGSRRK